jgi:hypothetical protein
MKHPTDDEGCWCISPKEYFDKYGKIPDTKADLTLDGLDEVSDHTLMATDGSDGRQLLLDAGFEILENPKWYFN